MEDKIKRIIDKEEALNAKYADYESLSAKIIADYRHRAQQEIHRLASELEAKFDAQYDNAKDRAYADRHQEIERTIILKTMFLQDYENNLEEAVNQVIAEVLHYGNR